MTPDLVDLDRDAVLLDAQPACGLVEEVDRLVRQEPVGDVAVAQARSREQCTVLDAHAVVRFVLLLQAAQDRDRVLERGLAHVDRLEAAFEGRVLLHVLAVLAQGGGADAPQFTAGEGRLEQVAGARRPLGLARTDHGVEFVDEEDDAAFGGGDFAQHGLQALLELAAVFGAGQQRAHIERHDAGTAHGFGAVTADDALREPFDDRRLAHAGFADEHGVVLRAA